MADQQAHHKIVIIGGGAAGISVAARMLRGGEADVAVIDPAEVHYCQPLWTLVGGGLAPSGESARAEAAVMPPSAVWIKDAATDVDPETQRIALASGGSVGYDYPVVCPGLALDWDRLPGAAETLGRDGVSSNYQFDLTPKTWQFIKGMRSGTAVFTMPSGPIKCAGAPQKIAYLACDWWRKQGVLRDIHVVLVLRTPKMFGVAEVSAVLEQVAARNGIDVRLEHEVVEVNPAAKEMVLVNRSGGGEEKSALRYDLAHLVPPQSAPGWIKQGPLADPANPGGYVQIDKNTMRHVGYPNIFSLGDAGSSPNSKTGAAIRKQAPVVAGNLAAVIAGRDPAHEYEGYASCPLTTARNRMLLAEFDYTMKPHPTIPLINTQKERYDMWLLKRYGLPFMYWNLMLKGRA
jgi:sulfide:quinone oxidoreductase